MPDSGAVTHGRPLCRCHGLPMDRCGPRCGPRWACAEKRRARQRAAYHEDPASANYTRTRRAAKARIRRKRRQIEELEQHLEEENGG